MSVWLFSQVVLANSLSQMLCSLLNRENTQYWYLCFIHTVPYFITGHYHEHCHDHISCYHIDGIHLMDRMNCSVCAKLLYYFLLRNGISYAVCCTWHSFLCICFFLHCCALVCPGRSLNKKYMYIHYCKCFFSSFSFAWKLATLILWFTDSDRVWWNPKFSGVCVCVCVCVYTHAILIFQSVPIT